MEQPLLVVSPQFRDALLSAWWFALGGCVGSFLNVVVYRTPRGMSLVAPGSHCPQCKHPIRWYDNIPILGWLHLRGRCRDCRTRISPRYPFVEAITACVFLLVGRLMCVGYGSNLPDRMIDWGNGMVGNMLMLPQCWGVAAFHVMLLATLLAIALIEFDQQRVPWGVGMPALIVAAIAPLFWPFLLRVPTCSAADRWMTPAFDVGAGLVAGVAVAFGLRCLTPTSGRNAASLAPILVGMYLGWQAVAVLGCITAVIGLIRLALRRPAHSRHIGLAGWLSLFTLWWIVAWRTIVEQFPWLG